MFLGSKVEYRQEFQEKVYSKVDLVPDLRYNRSIIVAWTGRMAIQTMIAL